MITGVLRAARLFRRGQKLAAQEHFAEAIAAFGQAQALRPRVAGIYLHQALALAEMSRLPEAVLALHQALAVQPGNPVLPLFLARIYADHADYTNAARWCARALAFNPVNCQALALQALIEIASGRLQQGCERLLQPLPLPVSALQRAVLWCSRSRMPSLLQQANAAMQGRVLLQVEAGLRQPAAPARTLAQQLLETTALHADETVADRLLSGLDWLITRVIVSIRRCSIALRYAFQPATRALQQRFLQAEDAVYRGQVTTAQTLYTQVAQQHPDMPYVQERLCEVCYMQGKFHEALRHLRRLLKQLPDTEQPGAALYVLLGELYCQVGQYEEARAALARAGPAPDYRLWYYLGLCQLQAGALQDARRSFTRAVRHLHPDIATLRLAEMARVFQGRS